MNTLTALYSLFTTLRKFTNETILYLTQAGGFLCLQIIFRKSCRHLLIDRTMTIKLLAGLILCAV